MFNLMGKSRIQGALHSRLSSHSRAPMRVLQTVEANRPSARAMQDGVRLALLHFFQQLTDFYCGRRNDLDTAPFRLR
jgi:hypothetical protein